MIKAGTKLFVLILITRIIGNVSRVEKRCGNSGDSNKLVSLPGNDYVCPRENDPMSFTECCDDGCCEKYDLFSRFDEELVMIIGVTVITVCVILMAVIVICCFWSKCPCYTTCRHNYTAGETIIYSLKEDPNVLMPNESEANHFTPCLVKIKKVEEF